MKTRNRLAIFLIIISFIPWFFSSDVVKLIATQRDVLLGRYSVEWFTILFFQTLALWTLAGLIFLSSHLRPKEFIFWVLFLALSIIPAYQIAVSLYKRFQPPSWYLNKAVSFSAFLPGHRNKGLVTLRPPNLHYQKTHRDIPPASRSYPHAPPGFPPTEVLYSTDAAGFRNPTRLEKYDAVALGDSFTEGSLVSNDETWPAQLSRITTLTVCNLGVAGTSPGNYLNVFKAFAIPLQPKIALVLLFEGNDFKEERPRSLGEASPPQTVPFSLLTLSAKQVLIRFLGPINSQGKIRNADIISWMPASIPPGPFAKYYAFEPRSLLKLYRTPDNFAQSSGWRDTRKILLEFRELCRMKQIRLLIVYAPLKAHVVLPLLRGRLTARELHTFASMKKKNLPPPDEFETLMVQNLDTMESACRQFCDQQGISFLSLTLPLREKINQGEQVYYTYDEHWTPLGHKRVAEEISRTLRL